MIVKDELECAKKSSIRSLLSKNEKILFSANLTKINKNNKYQDRNMMITTLNFFNLRTDGVLSTVSSLFNSNYMIKRKFDLKLIKAIVYAKLGNEFIVHVPSEFDYRFISERKDEIILYILYALHLNGIKELSFFFTNELELHDMTTHNSQKKKGVVHLPKGEQRMMNIESFEEYVKNKIKEQKEMDQATTNLISSDHNKLTINNFNLLKTLGKGGFGKVYLVQHKTTKELFALKTIKKLFIIEKKQFEQVQREKEILYEANHPFLVGLKAAFQTPDKLFFLMPFVQGGDLYASLKRRKIFTEEEVRFFVAQIIEGLGFLHTKDIIYQDIKPENILMEKNGYIKLADFGAAKYVSQTKNYKTFVGTADYIAPEVLKKLPYTKSVDWWGVGILIFELLFGRTPFFNKNTKISFRMILTENPIFPENAKVSEECKDFILQLLNKDHLQRLGAGPDDNLEIRKHPWMQVIDFDKLLKYELPAPIVPQIQDDLDVDNFNAKYTSERPKMTMLNEEIVKELAKYDELFTNFSYNDVTMGDKNGDDDDENGLMVDPRRLQPENPTPKEPEDDGEDSSDSEKEPREDVGAMEEKHLRSPNPKEGAGSDRKNSNQNENKDNSPGDRKNDAQGDQTSPTQADKKDTNLPEA